MEVGRREIPQQWIERANFRLNQGIRLTADHEGSFTILAANERNALRALVLGEANSCVEKRLSGRRELQTQSGKAKQAQHMQPIVDILVI